MIEWREQHYTKGKYRVTLEWIGEGLSGDYNPDDPDDLPLLRFTVYKRFGGTWEQLDDGSYCTLLTTSLTPAQAQAVLKRIWLRVSDATSPKRVCEALSWMDNATARRLVRRGP